MKTYIVLLLCWCMLVVVGCSNNPNNPPVSGEHPPATTVILTLIRTNAAGVALDTTSCTVRDTSVIKGKPLVEGKLSLLAGSTYKGSFMLFDESQTPSKDITSTIVDEKDAHVFKFSVKENGTTSSTLVITDLDKDSKGLDFGLNFRATTSAVSKPTNGVIHVLLEHHDDGNKAGATFDTDLNRDFPFELQ